MRCKKYSKKLLNRHIDNDLNEIKKADIDKHLKSCADCQSYIAEIKKIGVLLKTGLKPARRDLNNIPEGLWEKIETKLEITDGDIHLRRVKFITLRKLWVPLAAAAAAIILIVGGLGRNGNEFNADEYVSEQLDYIYGDKPMVSENYLNEDSNGTVIDMVIKGEL
ncbi:MAG: zf-HC2 domain-containing protein [Elusimicrobia bacterium]|jgi:hypothetical protein|nr:zf-HC2 domain-containing protein [Elusimicrobiota bacterium]